MRNRTVPATLAAAALAVVLTGCSGGRAQTSGATSSVAKPAILTASSPAGASTIPQPTITTTGVGTVNGSPDTMTIDIDVSTKAPHAADALQQNNAVAANVQQVLRKDGVATADIQTSGLSLQPSYPPAPTSYQVDDSVTATLRHLATAGSVIDDAVAAAGDAGRLTGVNLSISGTSPLMGLARRQAVVVARADAQQLADAAGEHLGALVSLTDQSSPVYPQNEFSASSSAGGAAAPVPVQAGTQQLSVNVTAVWAISA